MVAKRVINVSPHPGPTTDNGSASKTDVEQAPGPPTDLVTMLVERVERLEAEASEHRLRTKLLNRAVGVPEPGASIWGQLQMFVTGQVSAKLARFGPNRGCIIATLVLLCNFVFVFLFVSDKVSKCDQRAAVMDPEPAVADTYKNMFADGTNTYICATSVDGIQSYSPGDTCMLYPEEWVAMNGVCDVDTGRCAAGTDCTDCPLDPLCEPGRDGRPTKTENMCACAQDDFCCSAWDVSCSLCELGFDTSASGDFAQLGIKFFDEGGQDFQTDDGDIHGMRVNGGMKTFLDSISLPPVVREAIIRHHVSVIYDDHEQAGRFRNIRIGPCAANACSNPPENLERVEQLTRNALDDTSLRLWALREPHFSTREAVRVMSNQVYRTDGEGHLGGPRCGDSDCGDNGWVEPGYTAAGFEWVNDVAGPHRMCIPHMGEGGNPICTDPYVDPGLAAPLVETSPGDDILCNDATMASDLKGVCAACEGPYCMYEMGSSFGDNLSDNWDDRSPFEMDADRDDTVSLRPLDDRFPGCGLTSDARDMSEAHEFLRRRVGLEMSVRSRTCNAETTDPQSASRSRNEMQSLRNLDQTSIGGDLIPVDFVFFDELIDNTCIDLDPTACGAECQRQHCEIVESESEWQNRIQCGLLPGCEWVPEHQGDFLDDDGSMVYGAFVGASCKPRADDFVSGARGQLWTRGPVDAKMDQCQAFQRLRYDSCYAAGGDDALFSDSEGVGPLYRDGVCQVDSGECQPGTDCSDCPNDAACPGVRQERFTPCHLPGLECEQYVQQQFGVDSNLAQQCGIPATLEACAAQECEMASVTSVMASVLYIVCPDVTTELGAAMGYLFVVQTSATALFVIPFVLATGGSLRSAWDHTRSIIREDLATEAAEGQKLIDEEKQLGEPAADQVGGTNGGRYIVKS